MARDEQWIEDAAYQASERERNAIDAERAVEDMKRRNIWKDASVGSMMG